MTDNQRNICQSCSMTLESEEHFGTEADGSRNSEYCIHCYKNGQFTRPDATLDSMVEFYAPHWGEWSGKPNMPLNEARTEVRAVLSKLNRWKTQA